MISVEELELVDNAFDGYHIPSKPDILSKIEQILQQDESDLMALADLIATDIGVSSIVLKTINAPFYGMRRTISEIKQAVLLLGMEIIRALVVGVILRRAYDKPSCISLERFWDSTTKWPTPWCLSAIVSNTKSPLKSYTPQDFFKTAPCQHLPSNIPTTKNYSAL